MRMSKVEENQKAFLIDRQKNIESLAQSIWNLFADKVGQVIFDQNGDEEDKPLFAIDMDKDFVAKRHFVSDGHFEDLFQNDIYDYLIIGMADEVLDDGYELSVIH